MWCAIRWYNESSKHTREKAMPFELKFFKSQPTVGKKGRKRSPIITLIAGFLFVLTTAYLLYIPQPKVISDHSLEVGDIAKEDIIINKAITIEDKENTVLNRQRAVENVVPIYEHLSENQSKARTMINQWFQIIREAKKEYIKNNKQKKDLVAIKDRIAKELGMDFSENEIAMILVSDFFNKADLNLVLNFVKSMYDKKILTSLTGAKKSKSGTIKLVSKTSAPIILLMDSLYDLKKVKTELANFVRQQNFRSPTVNFTTSLLMEFIDVNVSYSLNLTRQEEQKISAAVNPALIKLKAGKVILRKGDEVSPDNIKILKLIAVADETQEKRVSYFYLILLILCFLTLFGNKFFNIWAPNSINREKLLLVTGATLTISAIVYRVSLFLVPLILKNMGTNITINFEAYSIFFAIPFGFGVLTIAFVFNLQSAIIFSFINSIMGGILCNWDFRIFLYVLLGNLAVSYGIEYYQRLKRSPIIKAAILWLLPLNMIMIVAYHFTGSNTDLMLLGINLVVGVFSAVISPILANFLIPMYEIVFGLVTELKLVELTNLNLPIFREMLEKAPGTYHHSLMVASLSEAAAQDLGLSPLLERAMALYHDIGKIDGPHFFTENHTIYKNPHPSMTPRDSAKNIISHIGEGLERADKLKLPAIVQSAITQHHGTKLVRFFYDKAREMSAVDSDGFDDSIFKYPGMKPTTIENAIIMLADQVEAASKSLASPTEEEIKNVIRRIIDSNVGENQFDECEGLTFKSINIIANSFHKKLSSIYHMRISYPGFDFKEKENQEESGKTKTNSGSFKTLTT
jgi:cyclic-di-AMP phosphodiesterase PgpH